MHRACLINFDNYITNDIALFLHGSRVIFFLSLSLSVCKHNHLKQFPFVTHHNDIAFIYRIDERKGNRSISRRHFQFPVLFFTYFTYQLNVERIFIRLPYHDWINGVSRRHLSTIQLSVKSIDRPKLEIEN